MSFGEFAGGFAEAFQNSYMAQQNRKQQDAIAKQQAKLIEMQLKNAELKIDAQTTVADLLTGMPSGSKQLGAQNQMLGQQIQQEAADPNMPMQEVAPFALQDPQQPMGRAPMGLTEMLADPTGAMALVNAGYLDVGDLLDFEQTKMIQEGMPNFNEMIGQLTGGGEGGFDPTKSPYIPVPSIGPNGPSITFQPNPGYVTPQQRDTEVKGLDKFYSQAVEAVDLLAQLEGTPYQSGNPLGDLWRTIGEGGSAFGLPFFTGEEQERLRDARGRLDKLLKTFVITSDEIDALTEAGSFSNAKLGILADASATLENGGVPNAQVIADAIEAKIAAADIMGNPVKNREEMLGFVNTIRASAEMGALPGAKPQQETQMPALPVEAVQKMSMEQLEMLQRAVEQGADVGQDVLRAAQKRWLELSDGG